MGFDMTIEGCLSDSLPILSELLAPDYSHGG